MNRYKSSYRRVLTAMWPPMASALRSLLAGTPYYARFQVTHRCNLQCGMCHVARTTLRRPELGLDEICEVASRLRRLGVRHVVLTGGEPFLRDDIVDIVSTFADTGSIVRIQTNGQYPPIAGLLREAAAAGLDAVSVSLDTIDDEEQDKICRGRGVVVRALETLRAARDVLPGICLANITVSARNLETVLSLVKHLVEQSIYVYVTPVMVAPPTPPGEVTSLLFRSDDGSFSLGPQHVGQILQVLRELETLRNAGNLIANSSQYLRGYAKLVTRGEFQKVCSRRTVNLEIFPDGGISHCKEWAPIANILDVDPKTYLKSREFARHMDAARAQCPGCYYGEIWEPQLLLSDWRCAREWARFALRR